MQLKNNMFLILLSILVIYPKVYSANTSNPLSFFTNGHFILVEGTLEKCGDGEFKIKAKGKHFELGYLHGFDLEKVSGILSGDAHGDENCKYEFKLKKDIKDSEALLNLTEKRLCHGKLLHTRTNEAHVEKDEIRLDIQQTGDTPYKFTCRWKRQSASTRTTGG